VSPPKRVGIELGQIAEAIGRIAASADPTQEWCTSFLLRTSDFEGEVIETVHVGWGTRRATVGGELVRVEIDETDAASRTFNVRRFLAAFVFPFVEGFGGIIQDTAEGFVVLAGNGKAVKDGHVEIPPTDEMVNAGLAAISGFELIDAWEGYLGKADLVRAIYSAMAAEVSQQSCRPLS